MRMRASSARLVWASVRIPAGPRDGGSLARMDDAPATLTEGLRDEIAQLTSSMCHALNEPKRVLIMYVLADGRMTVSDLCRAVGASQSNVSQHLAVLRERGLVTAEREGSNVHYSLRHPRVLDAIDILREIQADEVSRRQGLVTT